MSKASLLQLQVLCQPRRANGIIEGDPELAERFGGISLSGLQQDPHVRGMTPAALEKIGAELAAAQKPS